MTKITYKQNGYDKDVYCNKAKTKLSISKSSYGSFAIYFEETLLKEVYYLADAKDTISMLLVMGIGRDYANEK